MAPRVVGLIIEHSLEHPHTKKRPSASRPRRTPGSGAWGLGPPARGRVRAVGPPPRSSPARVTRARSARPRVPGRRPDERNRPGHAVDTRHGRISLPLAGTAEPRAPPSTVQRAPVVHVAPRTPTRARAPPLSRICVTARTRRCDAKAPLLSRSRDCERSRLHCGDREQSQRHLSARCVGLCAEPWPAAPFAHPCPHQGERRAKATGALSPREGTCVPLSQVHRQDQVHRHDRTRSIQAERERERKKERERDQLQSCNPF